VGTFFLFGKYTPDALARVSAARTDEVRQLIREKGGVVREVYALLGQQDLVIIIDAVGILEAMEISIALSKVTGINFSTCPALAAEEFDRIAG
jgi:uncharacterized protein with GYD domain